MQIEGPQQCYTAIDHVICARGVPSHGIRERAVVVCVWMYVT